MSHAVSRHSVNCYNLVLVLQDENFGEKKMIKTHREAVAAGRGQGHILPGASKGGGSAEKEMR